MSGESLSVDAQANAILKQELKEKWKEKTYEEIRQSPYFFGFPSEYLLASASFSSDFNEFSTTANRSTVLQLAELDMKKGAKTAELVFACCWGYPEKQTIQKLIDHGNKSGEDVVRAVFEFKGQENDNCLTILFDGATKYRIKTGKYPPGWVLFAVEQTCSYLIELAKLAELDLNQILNHKNKSGETVFLRASLFSEKISKQLLKETDANGEKVVKVNSISDIFVTPSFRVRFDSDFRK